MRIGLSSSAKLHVQVSYFKHCSRHLHYPRPRPCGRAAHTSGAVGAAPIISISVGYSTPIQSHESFFAPALLVELDQEGLVGAERLDARCRRRPAAAPSPGLVFDSALRCLHSPLVHLPPQLRRRHRHHIPPHHASAVSSIYGLPQSASLTSSTPLAGLAPDPMLTMYLSPYFPQRQPHCPSVFARRQRNEAALCHDHADVSPWRQFASRLGPTCRRLGLPQREHKQRSDASTSAAT